MLCAAEGGLKGAHAEEWVSLGALSAISMALEVSHEHRCVKHYAKGRWLLCGGASRGAHEKGNALLLRLHEMHTTQCGIGRPSFL